MTDLGDVPPALLVMGWDDRVAERASAHPDATIGRVGRVDRGAADVHVASGQIRPDLPSKGHAGAPVAVADVVAGDWVAIGEQGVVQAVLPRWSALVRRSADERDAQLLAANVDLVLLTVRCDRPFNARRLERLLTVAWESDARPVVVLTKADLAEDLELWLEQVRVTAGEAEVVAVSTVEDGGLDAVRSLLVPGETAVLIGESGAGKSSIVNALVGREVMATGEVRGSDHKGRHTTSTRELIPLGDGAVLLDTPGLRAVGIWGGDAGVARTFPDVDDLAAQCRFADCRHDAEPGCAVKAAAEAGDLDPDRFAAYTKLRDELEAANRPRHDKRRRP